jgi:hypothetical protein
MNTRMRGWKTSNGQLLVTARSLAAKTFRRADIPAIRGFAAAFAARAGMCATQRTDFALAVSEAAACATSRGPRTARLRLWTAGSRTLCEVSGDGVLLGAGPGDAGHGEDEALRRWLLRQLCDYVDVESDTQGVTVRFSMTVG